MYVRGLTGVVTYAATHLSPVKAEADCLGSGDSDIDREGRFACLPLHESCFFLMLAHDSSFCMPFHAMRLSRLQTICKGYVFCMP